MPKPRTDLARERGSALRVREGRERTRPNRSGPAETSTPVTGDPCGYDDLDGVGATVRTVPGEPVAKPEAGQRVALANASRSSSASNRGP